MSIIIFIVTVVVCLPFGMFFVRDTGLGRASTVSVRGNSKEMKRIGKVTAYKGSCFKICSDLNCKFRGEHSCHRYSCNLISVV